MSVDIARQKAAVARKTLNVANTGLYRDAVADALLNPKSALADWITEFKFGQSNAAETMEKIIASIEFEAGSQVFEQYIHDSRLNASPEHTGYDYRLKERTL